MIRHVSVFHGVLTCVVHTCVTFDLVWSSMAGVEAMMIMIKGIADVDMHACRTGIVHVITTRSSNHCVQTNPRH